MNTAATTGDPEVAWAAGAIECSGSFVVTDGRLRVQLKKADHELLERVAGVLGGRVYGPHHSGKTRNDGSATLPSWTWTSDGTDVDQIIGKLEPWLGPRRRAQIAEARSKIGAPT